MPGLRVTSYGVYLPLNRLPRAEMSAAFGGGNVPGSRTVAGPDEDSITMAVEAAGSVFAEGETPTRVTYLTSSPVYRERSNSSILHAALDLPVQVAADDVIGNPRTTTAMIELALRGEGPVWLVAADVRGGKQGGEFERFGCDAAGVIGIAPEGSGPTVASLVGSASRVLPVGDTWQSSDQDAPRAWDSRFSATALLAEAADLAADVISEHGDDTAVHFVVSAGVRRVRAGLIAQGRRAGWEYVGQAADDLGDAGVVDPVIAMAAGFEQLAPQQQLLVITVGDGVTVHLWRTGEGVGSGSAPTLAEQLERQHTIDYPTFLRWRGLTNEEPPRRPEPDLVSAPAALRNRRWKYGLVGGDCVECGGRNVPAQRICMHCRRPAEMVPVALRHTCGTVRSATVDHLAYAKGAKVVAAVVDLDGGGRLTCEVSDGGGVLLQPGERVVPTFRRLSSRDGVPNYFWKVRPVLGEVR